MTDSMDHANGSSPAENGKSDPSRAAYVLIKWAGGKIKKFIKSPRFREHSALVLLLVTVFIAGGAGGAGIDYTLSPSGMTEPHIGIIHHVLVDDTYIKAPPGSTTQWYMIAFEFSQPQNCDASCAATLTDVLGSGYSCQNAICSGEFKDIDEGDKTDSSDIFNTCAEYQNEKIPLTIVYTGRRDSASSEYSNIILVEPDNASLDPSSTVK